MSTLLLLGFQLLFGWLQVQGRGRVRSRQGRGQERPGELRLQHAQHHQVGSGRCVAPPFSRLLPLASGPACGPARRLPLQGSAPPVPPSSSPPTHRGWCCCRDDKIASKLSPEDKEAIESKVKEVIDWLDNNQLAEVEEFEHQQKELEGVCNPIISKMYGAAGGEGGPPGGECRR